MYDSGMNIHSLNPWRVKWFTKQAYREKFFSLNKAKKEKKNLFLWEVWIDVDVWKCMKRQEMFLWRHSTNHSTNQIAGNSFADPADLCFSWIDQAACRVVIEIWFVIFEGYECFALGSGVDPVVYIMNWRFHQLLKCSIGKLDQGRFVELDYLVEDIYCYSEFHGPCRAIIR